MNTDIRITVNGTEHRLPASRANLLLSDFLGELGNPPDMPCGGRATCKKCLVKASGHLSEPTPAELRLLTDQDRADHLRLSCLTRITGDAQITTQTTGTLQVLADSDNTELRSPDAEPLFRQLGAAIDIGTTTVCVSLFTMDGRHTTITAKNPQTAYGADVITRIEKALAGQSEELSHSIQSCLAAALSSAARELGYTVADIDAVVIAGNTAMLHLLTATDVEPLSHAPFAATELFGHKSKNKITTNAPLMTALGLPPETIIYLPRCISAFVGADISAAILASGMCDAPETALLVDLGTNGEIALWHRERLYVCSTAAGPAFEGAGISCGCYSVPGAIDKVRVQGSSVTYTTLGSESIRPVGLCGSGIVDAIAAMLSLEIIDETGAFQTDEDEYALAEEVRISAADVRQVQLAKGSVRAGVETLIEVSELKRSDIRTFYVAGGFGNYLNLESAAAIGLIPADMVERTRVIGNASLSGAREILLDRRRAERLNELATSAETIRLDANPVFTDNYMEYMMFS